MDTERFKRIKEIFLAALERELEDRPAFLDQACRGDEALFAEVDQLLACEENKNDFLESPAITRVPEGGEGAEGRPPGAPPRK